MAKNSRINMKLPSANELFTVQEERDEAKCESVKNIRLEEIRDFSKHPF